MSPLEQPYIFLIPFVTWVFHFLYTFIKTRLEYRNLPGPPHGFLFGHLPSLVKAVRQYPRDAHSNIALNHLAQEHNLVDPGCFYLDAFPLRNDRQLIITSPEVAAQVIRSDKHPFIANTFGPVLGRKTLAVTNGAAWKAMRTTFATAFGPANIYSMMPAILEESELFVRLLSDASGSDNGFVPSMSHMLTTLSFDLVCRLVLGQRMRSQTDDCELADLLHAAAQLPKPASLNPFESVNILRIGRQWYYEWKTKQVIDRMVLDRWTNVKSGLESKSEGQDSKVIIDMALRAHMKNSQIGSDQTDLPQPVLDILSDK
jgi:cytochrome P450